MHRNTLVKLASKASVSIALFLTALKVYGFYKTHSLSILSSLFDSGVDMLASVASLISITFAAKPADSSFRFGYGKLEAVAALIQSIVIIVSLLFLTTEVVQRLAYNESVVYDVNVGLNIMFASIILTLLLTTFQAYVIKKTDSIAIKADSVHYKTDLVLNMGVIASLYLSQYFVAIDAIFCLIVVLYVMWSMRTIISDSLKVLLDKEIDTLTRNDIIKIIDQHQQTLGFHNFRTRTSGNRVFIEAHIEMDPNLTLIDAHNIAHDLKDKIQEKYPDTDIILHQDPKGHDKPNDELVF